MVVSANKDTTFQQMVSYQRVMGQYAFDTYRNLLGAVTLNPAMGDYLDMVNNAKATGTTSANENFAREAMQLFTLGLVQLDASGNPVIVNGATVPEYDQTTVANMAKVMTGWTYGEAPGYASIWTNMPYYFLPMTAFESFHDTTAKSLNFPIPCTIAAGGTAESDLSAALDCVFQQVNVAPAAAFRLIQHFVMSSPSPAYVGRVASAFQQSGGKLPAVITAILTDPEALAANEGKLTEPILYTTNLLRALNATITAPDALTAQGTAMGQTVLTAPDRLQLLLARLRDPQSHPHHTRAGVPDAQRLHCTSARQLRISRRHQRHIERHSSGPHQSDRLGKQSRRPGGGHQPGAFPRPDGFQCARHSHHRGRHVHQHDVACAQRALRRGRVGAISGAAVRRSWQ